MKQNIGEVHQFLDCSDEKLERLANIGFDLIDKHFDGNVIAIAREIYENKELTVLEKIWTSLKVGGWINSSPYKMRMTLSKLKEQLDEFNDEWLSQ